MLTRIMTMAAEDHQPPLVRGRRVKLKYAHAGGYNPLFRREVVDDLLADTDFAAADGLQTR
jgi:predicted GTPase